MATVVEEFDPVSIANASLQFYLDGAQQTGLKFGCLGTIAGETELKEIIKVCAGMEKGKITKPIKMNLTLTGHVNVDVIRKVFGLSNEGLKPGIYRYSQNSKGKKFVLTADIIDEFQDVTKLIAFPNCVSATGLKLTIEAGADEVAQLEITVTAYPDEASVNGDFYYDAFVSELEDPTIADTWHSQFDYTLVEEVPIA